MLTKKRKIKKFRREGKQKHGVFLNFVFSIFLLLIIAFLLFLNWQMSNKKAARYAQIEAVGREIEILEEMNKDLKGSISDSTQQEYIEEIARERFNLKKPGEEVITVLPPEGSHRTIEEQEEKKSLWQKIGDFLGL